MDNKKDNILEETNLPKEKEIRHNSENSRQDEFQGELARRIKIREQRLTSQNSLVSSFMDYAVPKEIGGVKGLEPTRYGDWQHKGKVTDF